MKGAIMDGAGFIPDPGDDHLLLFVTNEQRNTLIMEAEWPDTIECVPDQLFYKMPRHDPRSEEMYARYGNMTAYQELLARQYRLDQAFTKNVDIEFIEPESRVYLYISDRSEAQKYTCHYDASRSQYYVPDTHPETSKLINKYTTKKAKNLWHEKMTQMQERIEAKEAALRSPIYTGFNCDAEITRPKGRKEGPPLNARLVQKMLKIRIAKNIIPKGTSLSKASEQICKDLRMMSEVFLRDPSDKPNEILPIGKDVTPSMVSKCLAPTSEVRKLISMDVTRSTETE